MSADAASLTAPILRARRTLMELCERNERHAGRCAVCQRVQDAGDALTTGIARRHCPEGAQNRDAIRAAVGQVSDVLSALDGLDDDLSRALFNIGAHAGSNGGTDGVS